ncbi:MAG: glycoside hydrolase family 3 protein, partial [bacterium]
SRIPVLITNGSSQPGMVIQRITEFPTNMAIGATRSKDLAYRAGRAIALEARAVGLHWPGPTCCDVNTNPNNPIINTRTFGDTPELVAELASALVKGLQDHGALAWGYHFPGHGDTDLDSHMEMPVLHHNMERLETVDLVPFKALIEADVKAICTSHIWFPELEPTEGLPVTLSRKIVAGLLRDKLGYRNVISTDSLAMQAIRKNFDIEEAVVMAFDAGHDVLLAYPDTEKCYEALVTAIKGDAQREKQLEESARRVLTLKSWTGLDRERFVNKERLSEWVGIPEHQKLALEIARKAVTVIKGEEFVNSLPERSKVLCVVAESRKRRSGTLPHFEVKKMLKAAFPQGQILQMSGETTSEERRQVLEQANSSDAVLIALFTRVQAYDPAAVKVSGAYVELIHELVRNKPTGVLNFGNPYSLNDFGEATSLICTYDVAPASLEAGVELIRGKVSAAGKLPVKLEVS